MLSSKGMLAILFRLFSFSFLFVGLAILVPLNYHINFRISLSVLHIHTPAGIAHKSIHELERGVNLHCKHAASSHVW